MKLGIKMYPQYFLSPAAHEGVLSLSARDQDEDMMIMNYHHLSFETS
jgi:hypothetical protein